MNISIDIIKELRDKTQASISDCRTAFEEANGEIKKAEEILRKKGIKKASRKQGRETSQGLIESYIHQNGRVGVLVELLCETDFVARTSEFKNLAHEIAMQVVAMNPRDVAALLRQEYIRDPSLTVQNLIKQTIAKFGENVIVKRFQRFKIGE